MGSYRTEKYNNLKLKIRWVGSIVEIQITEDRISKLKVKTIEFTQSDKQKIK